MYEDRIERAQKQLKEQDYCLLVLFPSSNMLYLSGFYDEPGERMLFFLVPVDRKPLFIAPELYAEHIRKSSPFKDIRVWKDSDDPLDVLASTVKEFESENVLIDDQMWASFVIMLRSVMKSGEVELASTVMKNLRMQKSSQEINYLERAGSIADRAFESIIKLPITGMTELELSKALEDAMIEQGAEKASFELLVSSGSNSAIPHHRAGNKKIEPGDVVVLDFGCKVEGYCSDTTRTIVCKEASPEVREIYEIVKNAQKKAVQAVMTGVSAQDIDRVARGEIAEAGYGEYFIHRTGHGIGLDVHEEPYITEGNGAPLEEGMSFSVEPGIYLPGKFGVRVEDIVVATSKGARRLNNSSRDLQVVG
ncbi:MAG: aminopeptidase P family protein [Spirochaetota bacterium]|nr:MAG: aminopeptidase P family protein [Spirochaetota bacterium]